MEKSNDYKLAIISIFNDNLAGLNIIINCIKAQQSNLENVKWYIFGMPELEHDKFRSVFNDNKLEISFINNDYLTDYHEKINCVLNVVTEPYITHMGYFCFYQGDWIQNIMENICKNENGVMGIKTMPTIFMHNKKDKCVVQFLSNNGAPYIDNLTYTKQYIEKYGMFEKDYTKFIRHNEYADLSKFTHVLKITKHPDIESSEESKLFDSSCNRGSNIPDQLLEFFGKCLFNPSFKLNDDNFSNAKQEVIVEGDSSGDVKRDKNTLPRVGLAMCSYERRRFFEIIIHNLMKQTYPKDKLTLYILDDSPRGKGLHDCIDELRTRIAPITVVFISQTEKITPLGKKRNAIVKYINEDYIANMDDDDYYQPQWLMTVIGALLDNPDKGLVGCVEMPHIFIHNDYNKWKLILNNPYAYNRPMKFEKLKNIGEASMAYTKEYFESMDGYGEQMIQEGVKFIDEKRTIDISCMNVLISTNIHPEQVGKSVWNTSNKGALYEKPAQKFNMPKKDALLLSRCVFNNKDFMFSEKTELEDVAIITVVRSHKAFIDLMIHNIKNQTYYDPDKVSWYILDDTKKKSDSLSGVIEKAKKELPGMNIVYKKIPKPINTEMDKYNLLIKYVKEKIIVHMSPTDYYFPGWLNLMISELTLDSTRRVVGSNVMPYLYVHEDKEMWKLVGMCFGKQDDAVTILPHVICYYKSYFDEVGGFKNTNTNLMIRDFVGPAISNTEGVKRAAIVKGTDKTVICLAKHPDSKMTPPMGWVNNMATQFFDKNETDLNRLNLSYEVKEIMTRAVSGNEKFEFKKEISLIDPPEENIHVICQYFKAKTQQRCGELLSCIKNNLNNNLIHKVHLLLDSDIEVPITHSKLIIYNHNKWLTYKDAWDYANNNIPDDNIVILCNTDIYFDDSLRKLSTVSLSNTLLSLLRYNVHKDGTHSIFGPRTDSQDSWICKTPCKQLVNDMTDIPLGKPGCDNRIAWILSNELGIKVYNPCYDIKSYHLQLDESSRTWTKEKRTIPKPYLLLNPCNIPKNITKLPSTMHKKGDVSPKKIVNTLDNQIKDPWFQNEDKYLNEIPKAKYNKKIKHLATVATIDCRLDLELLLHSIDKYEPKANMYVLCDTLIQTLFADQFPKVEFINKLDHYGKINRSELESCGKWCDFMMEKATVMEHVLSKYNNEGVLFLDADQVLTSALPCNPPNMKLGLSPHHIREEDSKKYGYFNGGMMWTNDLSILKKWRVYSAKSRYFDQSSLEDLARDYPNEHFLFGPEVNMSWWKIQQAKHSIPEMIKRLGKDMCYNNKNIVSVHTHFFVDSPQYNKFNNIIIELMKNMEHPVYDMIQIIKDREKGIPIIDFPKQPRRDILNHKYDTSRELIDSWRKMGLCKLKETKEPYIKWGETLLFDFPQANMLIIHDAKHVLMANEVTNSNPWTFWGRHPIKLHEKHLQCIKSWEQRSIESLFLGKIENSTQEKHRTQHDWSTCIEEFSCPINGQWKYNQDEYLERLSVTKFGLCLPGYGPKCNREIELMALGVVPIVTPGVDTQNYINPLKEGVHYLYAETPNDVKKLIKECSKDGWETISKNVVEWYHENASPKGSFELTKSKCLFESTLIHKPNQLIYIDMKRFSYKNILQHVDDFVKLNNERVIHNNDGGMKDPHMFAFYYFLKVLEFENVIESGIWKGQSTWLIDQVCPHIKQLMCIDPVLERIQYKSSRATYTRIDFCKQKYNDRDKNVKTLCFFDDHQNAIDRVKYAHKCGFKYLLFEDNYPLNEGDCLSVKQIIDSGNGQELNKYIKTYFEFPPFYAPNKTRWGQNWNDIPCSQPLMTEYHTKYEGLHKNSQYYTYFAFVELHDVCLGQHLHKPNQLIYIDMKRFSYKNILQHVDDFVKLNNERVIHNNDGGMKDPHMFAFYYFLKVLEFENVIESGIWKGQSTWLIDQVCPHIKQLMCIDPVLERIQYKSSRATYTRIDFCKQKYNDRDKNVKTLCFFDDHQNAIDRVKYAHKCGFKYLLFEDNYPLNEGDCLSVKQIIDSGNGQELNKYIKTYFEFPPFYAPNKTRWGQNWNDIPCSQPLMTEYHTKYEGLHKNSQYYTYFAFVELHDVCLGQH